MNMFFYTVNCYNLDPSSDLYIIFVLILEFFVSVHFSYVDYYKYLILFYDKTNDTTNTSMSPS